MRTGALTLWVINLIVLFTNTAEARDYSDYKVCRFNDESQFNVIISKLKDIAMIKQEYEFDIWAKSKSHGFMDIRMHDDILEQFPSCDIIIEDLNSVISETKSAVGGEASNDARTQSFFDVKSKRPKDIFFDEYRDLDTIYTWLDLLQLSFPDLVTVEWTGQTFEGRDLKALHISTNNVEKNPDKKTIIITGGVHAREWVSVSTVCYTIFQLLTRYGKSKTETRFLDHLDFLIIPVFNPDGYVYTWTHDRLWRKNRQQTYFPRCFGIDIDHSFDFQWTGSNDFPCSESYSGESPFEALEAESWDEYVNKAKSEYNIHGYLDFHSYAQEVLYPYGYSCDALPRDLENLLELSYGLSKAIRRKSGKGYHVLSSCEDRGSDLQPGLGSGSALDYMYHHRAYWAFQLKLRDTGNHGFLLPPKFIVPVGEEIYAAVQYFCEFILNPDL
ncbi:Ecm14 [Kluyveromyces lactis]|nr:Ecm14 [Kluyveromyces lactis]